MGSIHHLRRSQRSRIVLLGAHAVVVAIAILLLLAYMLSLITASFAINASTGLRSSIATVLPFTVAVYIGRFTNFFRLRQRMPIFNLFFIFTLWTILLLAFVDRLYNIAFPLGELLFSISLAATLWRYGPTSFRSFLSCCYGIFTGAMIFFILVGMPTFAI